MDHKEFGHRVNERRKELGTSQEALSEDAGISRTYLSLIERGEAQNVSTNVLNKLATALGVTPGELMGQPEMRDTLIPPALREFGRAERLSFEVVDKLSRLPRREQEPKTVDDWRTLYRAIRKYL